VINAEMTCGSRQPASAMHREHQPKLVPILHAKHIATMSLAVMQARLAEWQRDWRAANP
jgi:hypothetical protein